MYLSIDLWDKRCWIAVFIEWIVIPKSIVSRANLIKILKKYILEYNVEVIVVWLPFDLYQKDKKQLHKTENFIQKLEKIFPYLRVVGVDERYTSFEASDILNTLGEKDLEWKKDAISACLILETYLNKQ